MKRINWDADFADLPPIELPDGRTLETLADCPSLHSRPAGSRTCPLGECRSRVAEAAGNGNPLPFIARLSFTRVLHGFGR